MAYVTVMHAYNVYVNLSGNLCALPFNSKKYGMWYFDGQVFYQRAGQ